MESFLSFVNNFGAFPWEEDNDSRTRPCIASLHARDINGGLAEHWSLSFNWTDRCATFEAYDEGGFLTPSWNSGSPDSAYEWTEKSRFNIRCSPNSVNTKAKHISMNGCPYILTRFNCHTWASALAQEFGIVLDSSIEHALSNDFRNLLDAGYAISNITGAFQDMLPASLSNPEQGSQRLSADVRSKNAAVTSSRAIPSVAKVAGTGMLVSKIGKSSNRSETNEAPIDNTPSWGQYLALGANIGAMVLSSYQENARNKTKIEERE